MTVTEITKDTFPQDPVRYCIDTILKEARQEDRLVRQILYSMFSAYTNDPINLAINSPTGEGKSYVLTKVVDMFPEHDVIVLSHMTDKALFHRQGQYVIRNETGQYVSLDQKVNEVDMEILDKEGEIVRTSDKTLKKGLGWTIKELQDEKKGLFKNAKKVIDLSHKILIFLDIPPIGLFNAIMPLLSHDKYEVEYEYTDTHEGIKTRSNLIRGWPSVIFAAAVDYSHHDRWPEIQRRFIITNPKMTKEKYEDAVNYLSEKFGVPDFVYQKTNVSDGDKEEVRSIIRMIGDEILEISRRFNDGKNNIIIPYNECIKNSLPRNSASDMTVVRLLYSFLSLLAMVNIQQRPRLSIFSKGDLTMRTFPFASFDDLIEALFLMEHANGVRPYVLEWFHDVFIDSYDKKNRPDSKIILRGGVEGEVQESRIGLTTEELASKTKEILSKTYTKKKILDNFIDPLINQGYPTGIMTKNKKLFDNNSSNNYRDGKSRITVDPALFPDREYIISQIRSVLEYSETDGGSVTLQDHEGKEITVEELVKRYYDNPRDYFESDRTGSTTDISDNSQAHLSLESNGLRDIEMSRVEQIDDEIDRMSSGYDENDNITKELEDITDSDRDHP